MILPPPLPSSLNDKDDYYSDDNDKSEMNNKTETEYNGVDPFRILRLVF